MRTINQVLDLAKEAQEVRSDYKLALCLGIGESSLSSYRNGHGLPDEKTCHILATAMGEDPIILMVEMHAHRVRDAASKALWSNLAHHLLFVKGSNGMGFNPQGLGGAVCFSTAP